MLSAPGRTALLRRVGLNTAWLALARAASQALLGIFTLLAARGLGEAGFGQYSWIASIVLLGNVFTTFGTDTLLIREIARERRTARSALPIFGLQVGLSALLAGAVWAWTGAAAGLAPDVREGLRLYALAWFPLAATSVLTAVLRGHERMDLYLLAIVVTGAIQTAGAWAVLSGSGGLIPLLRWLLLTQCAGAFFAGGLCLTARLPAAGRGEPERGAGLWGALRGAMPLALISVLGLASQRLGIFALSLGPGDAAAGWFAAGAKAVEAVKLAHVALLGALLPALSHLAVQSGRGTDDRGLFRTAFLALLAVAVPAALLLSVLAGPVIQVLYGPAYAPAGPVLQVLAWSLAPYTVNACISLRWITRGQERRVLAVTGLGTAVTLAAALVLVGGSGPVGAAWAVLAGETAQAAAYSAGTAWKRK